jgi:hypothetical protein
VGMLQKSILHTVYPHDWVLQPSTAYCFGAAPADQYWVRCTWPTHAGLTGIPRSPRYPQSLDVASYDGRLGARPVDDDDDSVADEAADHIAELIIVLPDAAGAEDSKDASGRWLGWQAPCSLEAPDVADPALGVPSAAVMLLRAASVAAVVLPT